MSPADIILVRILAHTDALRVAVRDWTGNASANRYLGQKAGGVPYRVNTDTRPDEATRKAGERELAQLAGQGLLTVTRGPRVKYPLCALTPAGDAATRSLAGLPGKEAGRRFLAAVAAMAPLYAETLDGRWCPEVALNGGNGWGYDATPEHRRGLVRVELEFLAAAAQGWAVARSSVRGHAAYAPTPAGLAVMKSSSVLAEPYTGPTCDVYAVAGLYWSEQAAKEQELQTRRPDNPCELGSLPLSMAALVRADAPAA